MPQQSWQRAAKKAAWTQLLCGPTYSPSTLQRGMTLWIASSRDSRARICPLRAAGLGSTESVAGSSSTFSTLPMLAVRGASFWRTSQESLVPQLPLWTKKAPPSMSGITTPKAFRKWALKMAAYSKERPPESWENWPTAGGMRNGTLFQRPTWVPAMGGQGGSALRGDGWATPDCNTSTYSNGKMGPNIRQQASQWLTPNVPTGGRSVSAELVASKGMTDAGEKKTVGLESQTKHWATPNAHDGRRPGADLRSTQGANLSRDAAVWPTPRGTDGTKGGPNQAGSKGDLMLPSAAAQWPTPAASEARLGYQDWTRGMKGTQVSLSTVAMDHHAHSSHLAQQTHPGPQSLSDGQSLPQPSTKRLNPAFVEWLMGWPVGHTIAEPRDYAAEEMELWRSKLQSQLCAFFDGQE